MEYDETSIWMLQGTHFHFVAARRHYPIMTNLTDSLEFASTRSHIRYDETISWCASGVSLKHLHRLAILLEDDVDLKDGCS